MKTIYIGENFIDKTKRIVKEKARDTWNWTVDHKEDVVAAVTVAGGVTALTNNIVRMVRPSALERHDKRVAHTYYDPSTGLHWNLKRKATNSDRVELMRRKRNGETTEKILKDLRLIR